MERLHLLTGLLQVARVRSIPNNAGIERGAQLLLEGTDAIGRDERHGHGLILVEVRGHEHRQLGD